MWRILRIGALVVSALVLRVPFVSAQSRPGAAPPPSQDSAVKTSPRRTVLSLERSPQFGAILVSVQVNGKPAVLILDT